MAEGWLPDELPNKPDGAFAGGLPNKPDGPVLTGAVVWGALGLLKGPPLLALFAAPKRVLPDGAGEDVG